MPPLPSNPSRWRTIGVWSLVVGAAVAPALWVLLQREAEREPPRERPDQSGDSGPPTCPALGTRVVDFTQSANNDDLQTLEDFKAAVGTENVIVRLGPDIELNFSKLPAAFFPIRLGRCVTLISVSTFESGGTTLPPTGRGGSPATGGVGESGRTARGATGPIEDTDVEPPRRVGSARTPRSLGPILRFGTEHQTSDEAPEPPETFLEVRCYLNGQKNDGVRISGIRVFGPSLEQQTTDEVGIRIIKCIDIEISNMEIAGWGGAGIEIQDRFPEPPDTDSVDRDRITRPEHVRIFGNYFHHNQHAQTTTNWHASGYGVVIAEGAWARVSENVFDVNRHAIAASGDSGGYDAMRNLVLKGGGTHYRVPIVGAIIKTHQFDVHGDRSCYFRDANCGYAGVQFRFTANAFQYTEGNAIKLRGRPVVQAVIERNVFAHTSPSDAIALQTPVNVLIQPGNVASVDTFGTYGVCDFDGDAVDDLFLATGASWWYSSFGEFHWSYMNDHTERLTALRFGYFDDDLRCDVLTERGEQWFISSGGYGDWQPRGAFGAPLSQVRFGRFDPSVVDLQPGGVTRRTTHAWWRTDNGQWKVKSLSTPADEWLAVESSTYPLSELQFGDFDGDGGTDVLGVVSGRWWMSKSGRDKWAPLNRYLGDPVSPLLITNMDADDNIDDILKVERRTVPGRIQLVWSRSKNGTDVWRPFKTLSFDYVLSSDTVVPGANFVGRFGAGPGGGIMAIDQHRFGWFYVPATPTSVPPDFKSVFPY